MAERPRLLIEEWLPIEKIGAESLRDASAAKKPPLNRLHVWWARRPLTVSRAAILASLLPAWAERERWPEDLQRQFATQKAYQDWFLRLIGIFGDPAGARRKLAVARATGRPIANPYGYDRAFTYNPSEKQVETLRRLLEATWGKADLAVMDPMSGGGSIPFEALRYGFDTHANELNPVASVILKATLDYPRRFGPGLAEDLRKYGAIWAERVQERLKPFYSPDSDPETVGMAYLWARTVPCPRTGKPVPLSPNWWLLQGADPVGVKVIADPKADECRFEIVRGKEACAAAGVEQGTVKRGNALSPWTGDILPNAYLKAEAEAGRMGQQLYCVARKVKGGFGFRPPVPTDAEAYRRAEQELRRLRPGWEAKELFPADSLPMDTESWTHGNTPAQYGAREFGDLFSPRQLLALTTALEELREVQARAARELDPGRAEAVGVGLALALDKACDYNSRMARWHSGRGVIANTFDRHDFAFKWSHTEFDACRNQFPWVVSQVAEAMEEIAKLGNLDHDGRRGSPADLQISTGSAGRANGQFKLHLVCTDPPYYDNVMYSELSDFFYVWLRRSAGPLLPQFFADRLTNKEDEAVANPARFHGQKGAKELAARDYERKMGAAFQRMVANLDDRGAMTVMFTNSTCLA